MNRTAFAICLLVLLLGFCILSSVLVRLYSQTVNDAIAASRAQAARNDVGGAADRLQEAKALWRSHERYFGVVLSHSEIDDVNMMFAELAQYAELGDRDDFLAGTARLIATIEHIREMELPSYHNLL